MKPRRPGRTIGVAEFKAHCLKLLDAVDTTGERLTITKRGEPIATVAPIARARRPLKGLLRDRLSIHGDIVNLDWTNEWEATR